MGPETGRKKDRKGEVNGLVWWVLWHINFCRLFNDKSIFM